MGEYTHISWCHHTWSAWFGCVEVSPACDFCYAREDNKRYGKAKWGKDSERIVPSENYWAQPLKWNRNAQAAAERRRVFCGSWNDVMEEREDLNPLRERLY